MDVFIGLIEDGVPECAQIAKEMKTSPATVSRPRQESDRRRKDKKS
jgi:orotate phosphoribosyltransferase-like protein